MSLAATVSSPHSGTPFASAPVVAAPQAPFPSQVLSPLLMAPIGRSIARLAAPTMAVMVAQAGVSIAETAIVGRLGTDALAGFALVFPLMMLMTMMAAGGIGGGIAGAVARAVGAGQRERAGALVPHAIAICLGFALAFMLLMWLA